MEDPSKFDVKTFKILKDFTLEIKFYTGKIQVIDFSKVNHLFWSRLKDLKYFNQVQLNDICRLEWPGDLDFSPRHLFYWEEFEKYYTSS